MLQADLTISHVDAPLGRWCEGSHHQVPRGATFKDKEVRFFRVAGKDINLVICEPCLAKAQVLAQHLQEQREHYGHVE